MVDQQSPLVESLQGQLEETAQKTEGANRAVRQAVVSQRRNQRYKWIMVIILLLVVIAAVVTLSVALPKR